MPFREPHGPVKALRESITLTTEYRGKNGNVIASFVVVAGCCLDRNVGHRLCFCILEKSDISEMALVVFRCNNWGSRDSGSADLIAQSLLIGWAESRMPWAQTPGLIHAGCRRLCHSPGLQNSPSIVSSSVPHGNLPALDDEMDSRDRWKKPIPDGWKMDPALHSALPSSLSFTAVSFLAIATSIWPAFEPFRCVFTSFGGLGQP